MFAITRSPLDFRSGIAAPPPLLDVFGGAVAAYSFRRLRAAYTGACVRVRRSSDNTEQDIGFVGNELDTASLLAFCGVGNGFVTTRYDHVGSNNQTQTVTTRQAQIVSSGMLITENSKPALSFASDGVRSYNLATPLNTRSLVIVCKPTNTTATNFESFLIGDSSGVPYCAGQTAEWISWQFASPNVVNGLNRLNGAVANLTTTKRTVQRFIVSMVHTASVTANQMSEDRSLGLARSWQGTRQEEIYWSSDQSSNLPAIEAAVNSYYGVY